MKINDLIQGFERKNTQSVANQCVVPILGTKRGDLSDSMMLSVVADSDYSKLTLKSSSNEPTLLPHGTTVMTKDSAQDRLVKHTNIISSNKVIDVHCVAPSDGGHIQEGTEEYSFAPGTLRIKAMEAPEGYDSMWPDSEKFINDSGVSSNRLQDFYKQYDRDLEDFIAQFEIVDSQIGAVVLINGKVRGIELYPSPKLWTGLWRKCLRDCYGAEAIKSIKSGNVFVFKRVIDLDKVNSFDDLDKEYADVSTKFEGDVSKIIESTLDEEVAVTPFLKIDDRFEVKNIESDSMKGQALIQGDELLYLSLTSK